ncbi:MAG: FISUMP domain-containing protein [Bacteroidota bacterium]
MHRILFSLSLIFTGFSLFAQTYEVGGLVWTTENAVIKTFRNGDPIPFAATEAEFKKAGENKQPAWCHVDFKAENEARLGIQYNHFVLTDARGFAPDGWRVPADGDFNLLKIYHSGQFGGYRLMKNEASSCGFNALPVIDVEMEMASANFWTNSTMYKGEYWIYQFPYSDRYSISETQEASVRFVQDKSYPPVENITLKIGKQAWDSKNLTVTTLRNGDPLTRCNSKEEWDEAMKNSKPAYSHYKYDEKLSPRFGLVYNYYALIDPRGLAPEHYHIPTEADWKELAGFLKGDSPLFTAGKKLKDPEAWPRKDYCTKAPADETGFGALPSGYYSSYGSFGADEGRTSDFWIAPESKRSEVYTFRLVSDYDHYQLSKSYTGNGHHVRCVMDKDYAERIMNPFYSIQSSGLELMDKNLDVAVYRNGDVIPEAKSAEEWKALDLEGKGAWCYLGFDPANGKKYGRIYNGHALKDSRGLAPGGWRLMTKDDYEKLFKDPAVLASFNRQTGGSMSMKDEFEKENSQWWMLHPSKPKRFIFITRYADDSYNNGLTTATSTGCYVRCIKE